MPKTKNKELTDRQREIFAFIYCQIKEKYPPTLREIGGYFGFSTKAALDHVAALERKGYIQRFDGIPRGISIVSDPVPVSETLTFEITPDIVVEEEGFETGEFIRLRRQAVGQSGDIALINSGSTLRLCKLVSPRIGIVGKVVGRTFAVA